MFEQPTNIKNKQISMNDFTETKYALFNTNEVRNILFLMFLQDSINKHNENINSTNLNRLKKKSEITKNKQENISVNMNVNTLANISANTSANMNVNNTYGNIINNLKNKYNKEFNEWLINLNNFFQTKINYLLEFVKSINISNKDIKTLIDLLNQNERKTLGDDLNYFLIFGYLLIILKIHGIKQIDNAQDYIYYYNLQQSIMPFILPRTTNINKMKNIINEDKEGCYSAILNDVFFFMNYISEKKNLGNELNIYDYFKNKHTFYIKELTTNNNAKSLTFFQKIFGSVGKIGGKKYAIYGKDGIDNIDEIIFIAYADNTQILVKVVTNEMKININKSKVKINNNKQKDAISITFDKKNKNITMICLGKNEDIIELILTKNNDYSIILNGELKYKLIQSENKNKKEYGLMRTDDPIVQPIRAIINDTKIQTIEIIPREFVLISMISIMVKQKMI